jgi:hypothetical protein
MSSRSVSCLLCGKKLSSKKTLASHFKTVHLGIKEHECPKCSKRFSTKQNLRFHVEKVHEAILEKYCCDHCDTTFSAFMSLRNHKRYCQLDIRKKSKANMLHKVTQKVPGQKRHKRGPICDICDKTYNNLHSLEQHKITVHLRLKDFKCEICSEEFTRKDYLKLHIQRYH